MKNIFITYNKDSDVGENTALRMQTLSSLYGIDVHLPYRLNRDGLTNETKNRIIKSRFVLAFGIGQFSEILEKELEYSLKKNIPVIAIFDKEEGRTINFENKNVKEIFIDYYHTDDNLHKISEFLDSKFTEIEDSERKKNNAWGVGLIAIGLGLLTAWALSDE